MDMSLVETSDINTSLTNTLNHDSGSRRLSWRRCTEHYQRMAAVSHVRIAFPYLYGVRSVHTEEFIMVSSSLRLYDTGNDYVGEGFAWGILG